MTGVDVEGLFRKFTVSEIRGIEKKVKADIEKKKEDLRQMVGRRYRDIIEAADSIRDMKLRADDILVSVKDVQKGFDRLQLLQQQLITAQQRAHLSSQGSLDCDLSCDTQLKLLQDLPELIWECLDEEDVLAAVWYALLSENIHRGFSMISGSLSTSKRNIFDHYTDRVRNLRPVILEKCQYILKSQDWKKVESENHSCRDCLCAFACLQNMSPGEVLDHLLLFQQETLSSMFDDPESSSREQFCKCLAALQWTALHVSDIFASDDFQEGKTQSSFTARINDILSGHWQPESFVLYLSQQSRTFNSALPTDVKCFHPYFAKRISDVELNSVRDAMSVWMQQCLDLSRGRLGSSLVYFESVKALTVLKRSVLETLSRLEEERWTGACRKVLSSELPLWDALIKDLLDERLKELVNLRVETSFGQLKTTLLEKFSTEKHMCGNFDELNFGKYMWTELPSDTPGISSGVETSSLTLKARGIPPEIYHLCRSLDQSLLKLQESLEKHYDTRMSAVTGANSTLGIGSRQRTRICSVSGDLPEIWKCLADACSKAVNTFIQDIEKKASSCGTNATSYVEIVWMEVIKKVEELHKIIYGWNSLDCFVHEAQVCLCLCELCPGLKACLSYQSSTLASDEPGLRTRKGEDTELWKMTKTNLSRVAALIYRLWTDVAVEKAAHLAGFLQSQADVNLSNKCLEELQEFEVISVEEETEAGEKVTSKLQVPVQCSRNLQRFFATLSSALNSLGAHRVPKLAMSVFAQRSIHCIMDFFETVLKSSCSLDGHKLSQKQSLQLLFDLRVVAALYSKPVASEEQVVFQTKFADLTEKLHGYIDPFDLDVLNPHMKRNTTKFFHKIMSLYGVVILPETATSLSRTPGTKIAAGSEQPQLLPLASDIARFQLLPVAAPTKPEFVPGTPVVHLHAAMSAANVGGLDNKRDSHHQRKRGKEDLPKSSSAAALSSFYDKISSSWFGM